MELCIKIKNVAQYFIDSIVDPNNTPDDITNILRYKKLFSEYLHKFLENTGTTYHNFVEFFDKINQDNDNIDVLHKFINSYEIDKKYKYNLSDDQPHDIFMLAFERDPDNLYLACMNFHSSVKHILCYITHFPAIRHNINAMCDIILNDYDHNDWEDHNNTVFIGTFYLNINTVLIGTFYLNKLLTDLYIVGINNNNLINHIGEYINDRNLDVTFKLESILMWVSNPCEITKSLAVKFEHIHLIGDVIDYLHNLSIQSKHKFNPILIECQEKLNHIESILIEI